MPRLTEEALQRLYDFDSRFRHPGQVLVGIDEAGRGPLAGPVVVAGVILPDTLQGAIPVYDSKGLSPEKRDLLFHQLEECDGIRFSIVEISQQRIDEINILQATHEGMRRVAKELNATLAFVDGLPVPRFPVPAQFIVKGDASSASIAAASILAKVHRDALMLEMDRKYPGYGFARHKGYGTKEHLDALRRLGPSPIHRLSFAPVRQAAGLEPQLQFPF